MYFSSFMHVLLFLQCLLKVSVIGLWDGLAQVHSTTGFSILGFKALPGDDFE